MTGDLKVMEEAAKNANKETNGMGAGGAIKMAMAFEYARQTVTGFVRAGLSGTAMGEQLNWQIAELSRTIAGIFGPEIQDITDLIRNLTGWIRSLSDETIDSVVYWVKFAAVFGAVVTLAPKIISAIMMIIQSIKALTTSMIVMQAFSGPKGWLALAAGAGIAAGALYAADKVGKMGTEDVKYDEKGNRIGGRSRAPLAPATSGFEAVEAAYNRIAQASMMLDMGKSIAEEQLDEQKIGNGHLTRIGNALEMAQPPTTRN